MFSSSKKNDDEERESDAMNAATILMNGKAASRAEEERRRAEEKRRRAEEERRRAEATKEEAAKEERRRAEATKEEATEVLTWSKMTQAVRDSLKLKEMKDIEAKRVEANNWYKERIEAEEKVNKLKNQLLAANTELDTATALFNESRNANNVERANNAIVNVDFLTNELIYAERAVENTKTNEDAANTAVAVLEEAARKNAVRLEVARKKAVEKAEAERAAASEAYVSPRRSKHRDALKDIVSVGGKKRKTKQKHKKAKKRTLRRNNISKKIKNRKNKKSKKRR